MKTPIILLLLLNASVALADSLTLGMTDQRGEPLVDVVAILTRDAMPAPEPDTEIVNQIDETFVPRVSVVSVGSAVNFPNQDQILHHVYSFSPARTFEVPLYAGTPAEPVVFDSPGIVVLGCNIHDWMQAWVVVTPSPWAGKTNSEGILRIESLDPGTYELEIWHPDQREALSNRNVEIRGDSRLELSLDVRSPLNLRSVPGGGSGYF